MVEPVRKLLRAGYQRYEAGEILFRDYGRVLDGVYLCGYCIECCLKVLSPQQIPVRQRITFIESTFRGHLAHDFEWLHQEYRQLSGSRLPQPIYERVRAANLLWSPALRYETGQGGLEEDDALEVLEIARKLFAWVKENVR